MKLIHERKIKTVNNSNILHSGKTPLKEYYVEGENCEKNQWKYATGLKYRSLNLTQFTTKFILYLTFSGYCKMTSQKMQSAPRNQKRFNTLQLYHVACKTLNFLVCTWKLCCDVIVARET